MKLRFAKTKQLINECSSQQFLASEAEVIAKTTGEVIEIVDSSEPEIRFQSFSVFEFSEVN